MEDESKQYLRANADVYHPSVTWFSLRIGPWEAAGDWAGTVNWDKNPEPRMTIKMLKVVGCQRLK